MKPSVNTKPIVLFLCSGNSVRSQMAEAFLRELGSDRFEARSAGLEPTDIHPLTHAVMNEVGIKLEGHRAKSVQEFLGKISATYVIFVCKEGEANCPKLWPFALRTERMPFVDPAKLSGTEEEQLAVFRRVRDEIQLAIADWLKTEVHE